MSSGVFAISAGAGDIGGEIDFGSLVEVEQPRLQRLATRLVRDEDEARDLVQTTFADAYERRRSLRDPAAAGAWLRRILVSRALNQLRRRRLWHRLRGVFSPAGPEPADAGPPADALVADARRLGAVRAHLRSLPARQAAAFTLRYLEGLGLDEVADAMGVGRGTARTHIHRALTSMRAALADPEEDT